MKNNDAEDRLDDFHAEVKKAIGDICDLAEEKKWSYMILLAACKSLAESTHAVLDNGLAKKWDDQDKDRANQGNS